MAPGQDDRRGPAGDPGLYGAVNRTPALVLAIAVLVCGGLIATEVWREWRARSLVLEEAQRTTANLARSLAQHADETFEVMDTALVGLVERLEQYGLSSLAVSKINGALQVWGGKMPRLRSLVVLGPDGHVVASSTEPSAVGEDRSDRHYFRHHLADPGREPLLGPPLRARSDGRTIVTLSRRIQGADGSFQGVARAAVDANYFHDFYAQFSVAPGAVIALARRDGSILSQFPHRDGQIGASFGAGGELEKLVGNSPEGALGDLGAQDGPPRIGSYRLASEYPLVATASIPESEALAAWRDQAIWRVASAVPVILLIAAAGGLLTHQMRRRHKADTALREAEARFRIMAENSSDMLCRVDVHGYRTYVSPASLRLLGLSPEELVGRHAFDRVHPKDRLLMAEEVRRLREGASDTKLSYRTCHRDGTEIWLETTVRVLHDPVTGARDGVVTSSRDVTERKRLERQLLELARTDALTGLANRRSFDEALAAEWHRAIRTGSPLTLVILDVDRFKLFNDAYGHRAGDECLQVVAGAIRDGASRPGDLVVRYGGEEIALLLPGTDPAAASRMAETARRSVQNLARVHVRNTPFGVVTASAGVATFQRRTSRGAELRPADLIEAADRALYAAKQDGRNRIVVAPGLHGGAEPAPRRAA